MASRAIRSLVRPTMSMTVRPVVGRAVTAVRPVRSLALTPRVVFNQHEQDEHDNSSPFPGAGWFGGALVVFGGLAAITKLHDVVTNAEAAGAPVAGPLVSANTSKHVDYAAVRKAIVDLLDVEGYDDGSRGPLLVRLAWHAAGTYDKVSKTGGSDGATMRFAGESSHGANAGLDIARDALEVVKKQFPNISYADLWTLAGSVAIEEMGGPSIPWRAGRNDVSGPASPIPDGRLPDAAQGPQHVRDIFYRMGFNDQEIVALLGAHALGRCHEDRSGFKGPWTRSPTTFSNEFFRMLLEEQWTENKIYTKARQYQDKTGELMMLPADLALTLDPVFKKYVELYAKDENLFFKDFAAAWIKLLELGCNNLAPTPALPVATATPVAAAVAAPVATTATPTPTAASKAAPATEVSWWKKIFGGK